MKQQVDLLIHHALLVTVDDHSTIIEDGALAIRGERIIALGQTQSILEEYEGDQLLDATNRIILPGLIDAHAHLATVLLRGLAEDLPLEPWLQKVWLAEKAVMTAENIEGASRLAMCELVLGGVTCAVDMYWYPQASALAAREVGFRLVNGPVFLEMENAPDGLSFAGRLAFAREYMQQYRQDALVRPLLMPHSTYTDSPDALRKIKALAEEWGVGLHIHTAETAAEVRDVQARYGQTPIHLLHSLGLLDEYILLAHCVHLEQEEIDLVAISGAGVVHNPVSNMKLASGFAPVTQMLRQNINLSIGTDGAQSSNDLDMWWAMRLAALLQKGIQQDATVMKAQEVLRMATIGAARSLGMGEQIGSLEAGKIADLIILRRNAPHLTPLHDLYAHLVYTYGREDIEAVMINGQWVMQSRQLLQTDLQRNMEQVNEIAKTIS